MNKNIPLSVPNLKGNEKLYVDAAIDAEWVSTGGKYITDFEEEIAKYLNVEQAVACQSGTAGIHLALILSGVNAGDEVIVPALTFIAAVNPIKYLGAEPIFMDCDDSLCLDVKKLEDFIVSKCEFVNGCLINSNTRRSVKAVVVVHVFGNMVDMDKLMGIAQRYNLIVIEDATEALGSKYISGPYAEKYAGTIGDFGVYSFNGNKIITTGGGGMLVSKDIEKLKRAKYLSTQAKDDAIYFIHNEIGYNYRMTNIQAAIGIAQLEQLNKFIRIKKNNYKYYKEQINKIYGLELLDFNLNISPNFWFYSLFINTEKYILTRNEVIKLLANNNIESRPIWALICNQLPYKNNETYKIEKANYYINNVINIPCSTNLTFDDIDIIINVLKSKSNF